MSDVTAQAVAMHAELVRQHGEMVLGLLRQEQASAGSELPFDFLLAHSSVSEGWNAAEATEQQKKLEAGANETEYEDSLRGDLSRGELNKFARDNGFTPELANALWWMFSSARLQIFLQEKKQRKLGFTADGKVRRRDLKRLSRMKDLQPSAFRTYGPKTHALLMGLLTAMFTGDTK